MSDGHQARQMSCGKKTATFGSGQFRNNYFVCMLFDFFAT